ncbi:septum formation family protein [Frankia sp. Cas3]|uniref:septum formation family protein n=1 Tax=Frankia sp. Cas3 TaxID=3073926 RepID=UPI002AD3C11F|nr:septum formation family protein [Frankia sp. Cas3]
MSKDDKPRDAKDDDPFAGLVLDADFVAGATTYEAPARTREAVARYGAATGPGQARSPYNRSGFRRANPLRRRWLVAVVIVFVLLLAGGYVAFREGGWPSTEANATSSSATSTGQSLAGSPTAGPSSGTVALDRQSYSRGHCYTWNQDIAYPKVDEVSCASPHLFEAIKKTSIDGEYPPGSAYPTDAQWDEISDRHCGPIVRGFLGYPFDPYGRFANGPIRPTRSGWDTDDRNLVCGLIAAAKGSGPGRLAVFTGLVEGADQAWVYPAGTCLELTETENKGEVPCSAPHQAEATGTATLPNTSNGEPPSDTTFADLVGTRCDAVATQFLGRAFARTSTMQVGWLTIAADSWRAGTRTLTCTIRFTDAAGRLAAVTGELTRGATAGAGTVMTSLRSVSVSA